MMYVGSLCGREYRESAVTATSNSSGNLLAKSSGHGIHLEKLSSASLVASPATESSAAT